jgi:thiol-disulfide isomerase/thioredoxin
MEARSPVIMETMYRHFAAMLVLAAIAVPGTAGSKSEIAWKPRAEAVWQEAKLRGKPLLVEVWANWCGPCQAMDHEVWADPRIIALSRKFECVSLDMSRKPLAFSEDLIFGTHGRYEVKALPTIMILDPWREMLLFNQGYIHSPDLLAILREIPSDYNGVRLWRDALDEDRDNARALVRVGGLYDESTAFGIANRYYREALRTSAVKEDEALREDLMFQISSNEIRRADWHAARKALGEFQKRFPRSNRSDQVLLGFLLADVRQGNLASAEKRLAELQETFPASSAVGTARGLIAILRQASRAKK